MCGWGLLNTCASMPTADTTSGHHVYKSVWTPTLGEELECRREGDNDFDQYAVAVLRRGVVGHIPRKISTLSSIFLQRNGRITCVVTGSRFYSVDLPQGGLEVPCLLKFQGDDTNVSKVKKLLSRHTAINLVLLKKYVRVLKQLQLPPQMIIV